MTRVARDFVSGKISLPRELTVKNREVISSSANLISYREACKTFWPEIADHIERWRRADSFDENGQGMLL